MSRVHCFGGSKAAAYPSSRAGICRGGLLAALLLLLLPVPAVAQVNFKPLERGDYQESEESLQLVRGLEVSGAYGLSLTENSSGDLSGRAKVTGAQQDFRLHFKSVLHRDVSMNLVLELLPRDLNQASARGAAPDGRLTQTATMGVNAREAYLRYYYNPDSPITIGKHELSLGDRRGKTMDAIVAGATFDCRIGTWCMPLGVFKISDSAADWVYHWALDYRAWDGPAEGFREALEVEVFRIIYTEHNTPLGLDLGPTYFNASAPSTPNATQVKDDNGAPVYYDSVENNYYGLRVNWEAGRIFANADVTASQGRRKYHLYRKPDGGILGPLSFGPTISSQGIAGTAVEAEAGYRWSIMRTGLRFMSATGDTERPNANGQSYLRALSGYHEITPGTYRGTRLYFNGGDSSITDGSGLGHSIANTTVTGAFFQWNDRDQSKVGYWGGLYFLSRNEPVTNSIGHKHTDIGVELDNMIKWYFHKAVRIEAELNVIFAGGAFSISDFVPPSGKKQNFVQAIGRLVYEF